jgi:hypothetical protein
MRIVTNSGLWFGDVEVLGCATTGLFRWLG